MGEVIRPPWPTWRYMHVPVPSDERFERDFYIKMALSYLEKAIEYSRQIGDFNERLFALERAVRDLRQPRALVYKLPPARQLDLFDDWLDLLEEA